MRVLSQRNSVIGEPKCAKRLRARDERDELSCDDSYVWFSSDHRELKQSVNYTKYWKSLLS